MKFKILSLSLIMMLISGFFFCAPVLKNKPSHVSASYQSFDDFHASFNELIKNDDFSVYSLDDSVTIQELTNVLPNSTSMFSVNNVASCDESNTDNNQHLEEDDLIDICEELDYNLFKTDDGYQLYSKYKLKRIIAYGEIKNSFDAHTVLTYEDYNILAYETEEQTQYAYSQLMLDNSLTVLVSEIIFSSEESSAVQTNMVSAAANAYYSKNIWGAEAIDVDTYLDHLQTNNHGDEVIVAVLDTGITSTHELFNNRLLKDAYGNTIGFDFTSNNNNFSDGDGHGTHVSGTIAEITPNNVKILPMKVLNDNGEGSWDYITTALTQLTTETSYSDKVVCANLSLGNKVEITEPGLTQLETMFTEAFDKVRAEGILPVVAAGNESWDTSKGIPAKCDNAITVGAIKGPLYVENDYIYGNPSNYTGTYYFDTSYSNYGDDVDIVAPGTWILSASNQANDEYVYYTGTSMAAPHVAAAVALLKCDEANLPLTIDEIETKLLQNCTTNNRFSKNGASLNNCYGMLNFTNFKGNIAYTVSNTTATYDGVAHNIGVTNIGVASYTLSYRFETEASYSTNISTNSNYINYTNGAKKVYFKITATGYKETTGYATLTINQAPIAIDIHDQTHTYGDPLNLTQSKYTKTSGTIYGADSLGLKLKTTANSTSSVGTYDITASITNTNYSLSYSKGTLTVKPREVSISLQNQTSEYSDPISLDDSKYTITSAVTLVPGDNLNLKLATSAKNTSPVGEYSLTVSEYNTNYHLTITEAKYIITKKTIILSSSQTGYYGVAPSLNNSSYSSNVTIDKSLLTITMTTDATASSPVGSSYKIFFNCVSDYYAVDPSSVGTYSIYQQLVTLKADDQESVYGENLKQLKFSTTYGQLVAGDDVVVTLSLPNGVSKTSPVGTYNITLSVSGSDVGNYSFYLNKGTYSITPRPITVVATEQTSMYGDAVSLTQSKYTVIGGLVGSDTLNVSLSTNANSKTPVGQAVITLTCENNSNYDITTENGKLTIEKREIEITINNQSCTHGNISLVQTSYNVTSTRKIVNGDNLNIQLKTNADNLSPVGTYEIYLEYSNDYYDVTQVKGTLTIAEQVVTITVLPQSSTYGNDIKLNQNSYIISDPNVNVALLNIGLSTTLNHKTSVGTYENAITATTTNVNVALNVVMGTLTITKRPINIKIDNQSSTYGNIDIDQNKYNLDSSKIVNGDTVSILLNPTANNFSTVGDSYEIFATTTNENYELIQTKGTLTVEKLGITITLQNQEGGYYGDILFDELEYSLSREPINGDDLKITLSTTATNLKGVGNYPITFSYTNDNYLITGSDAVFTINPRPITIEISQTSVYGNKVELNKTGYTVTSIIKKVAGDDLNLSLTSTQSSTSLPNEYTIMAECLNENYDVTFAKATLTIEKRPLIIKATSQDKEFIYGEEVVLNSDKYSIENLVNGDTIIVKLHTTANNTSPAGTYTVEVNYVPSIVTNYYDITLVNGSLTILKREIEITISDQEFAYGEEFTLKPLYTITSSAKVVNGDDLNVKLSTKANISSPAGEYPITLAWNNDNYNINVVEGTLTIKQADLTITIHNQTGVYGNIINLDQDLFDININIDKQSLGVELSTNAESTSPVGDNYEITATYTNPNYTIAISKGSFIITPRPITITLQNQTVVYGSPTLDQNKFTASEKPINADEDFEIVLNSNAIETSTSGETFDITFTHKNLNYIITAQNSAKVTIKPRPIEININQSGIYGDKPNLMASDYVVVSGTIVNDDDLQLELSTSATNKSAAGTYHDISVIGANSNYSVVAKEAKYLIEARPISIEIKQSGIYGSSIELNPDNYTIQSGNLVNSDNLNLSLKTTATTFDNCAVYPITIEDHNQNYNITLTCGEYSIIKRPITILSKQSCEYGNVTIDNNLFILTSGSLAFISDELNISFTTNAELTSKVGVYDLYLNYNNDNYDVSLDQDSELKISPRSLTIALANHSSIYGEPVILNNTDYSITSGSLFNNDKLNFELKTLATSQSSVGNYSINCKNSNTNYRITLTNNKYEITKRPITIKLKDQSTPHGIMFEIDQNAYEIIEGTLIDETNLGIKIKSNAGKLSFIGNYKLTATAENENYDVSVINANLKVNISVEDVCLVIIVLVVAITVPIAVVKHKKKKSKNKELFDKYIGW